ncbi:MAG: hypothetical protein M1839_008205 [Geoglossum umbratile]|nr:MAG: hypothetical protein M1839_008205 [Geoglossum umbratile]
MAVTGKRMNGVRLAEWRRHGKVLRSRQQRKFIQSTYRLHTVNPDSDGFWDLNCLNYAGYSRIVAPQEARKSYNQNAGESAKVSATTAPGILPHFPHPSLSPSSSSPSFPSAPTTVIPLGSRSAASIASFSGKSQASEAVQGGKQPYAPYFAGLLSKVGGAFDNPDESPDLRKGKHLIPVIDSDQSASTPPRQRQHWRTAAIEQQYPFGGTIASDAREPARPGGRGPSLFTGGDTEMSSTMQPATHQPQSTPLNSSPKPNRQYQQQQQTNQQLHLQQVANASPSATSSRRPSRRSSGNNATPPTVNSPQLPQFYSPTGSNAAGSDKTTPRAKNILPSTNASPATPTATAFPPSNPAYITQIEVRGGPPIPPPPRTSSQRIQSTMATASASPAETGTTSRKPSRTADERSPSSRAAVASDGKGSRERGAGEGYNSNNSDRERAKDDISSPPAAAASARARRRTQQSPREDGPQRSSSTRESRAKQPATAVQSHSTSSITGAGTGPSREGSAVLSRVIVTDPEVDIERERERMAEAIPQGVTQVTGLGLVGSEGIGDGGRGGSRTRQDHSGSNSRRKETKFGDYILGQTLGEGEFGKVKMGWKKDGGVQVAIKLIRRESLGSNPSRLPKIYREISILQELSHPNIVRLHEMVETDHHIGIILEYASGGELFDHILVHRYLKDQPARRLFAQLISGVGYLHKKGIVHRDLKLENLLLDRNRNIIITDFGFANTFDPTDELSEDIEYSLGNKEVVKKMDLERIDPKGHRRGDLMQTSCGSPCYAAPELVVSDSLYTGMKVDVWSCGVILYAMLAGYLPFDDDPANPEGDNINLLYKYIVSTPLTFPEYVTPHARDLLRRILVPNPRKRADLFEVARHSWLSEYSHVVSIITSSTTTTGDIANTTVTAGMTISHTSDFPITGLLPSTVRSNSVTALSVLTKIVDDHADVPLLARSASVREPSTRSHHHTTAVGGLTQKHGNVDQDSQAVASKTQRDAKRRTVQVEYVAPHSQTARGESSSGNGPSDAAAAAPATASPARTRARSGSQGPVEVPSISSQIATKPPVVPKLPPKESGGAEPSLPETSQKQVSQGRSQQRSAGYQQNMPPPQARPTRDVPRSVSDSTGAFGVSQHATSTSIARPNTGGSMTSNASRSNSTRLPSRGSYSRPGQPAAPAVAATNAQGRLAQPKTAKPYVISGPIPQTEVSSMGRPSTTQMPPRVGPASASANQSQGGRGHKRSNTVSGFGEKIFGRSGSFFGSKSHAVPSQGQSQQHPPVGVTSGAAPVGSPRQSFDSRRSTSFGFGRKSSALAEKPRRFSLLPASFSLKNLGGSSKEIPPATPLPTTEQRDFAQTSESKIRLEPQALPRGRGQSRSTSRETSDSIPIGYDGQHEYKRDSPVPQPRRGAVPVPNYRQTPRGGYPQSTNQENFSGGSLLYPTFPNVQGASAVTVGTEASQDTNPQLPGQYEDERKVQGRWSRGPGVLQKGNRRFIDAYEPEPESGHGPGGHSSGSSGAARKVMDFFRRRGKARAQGGDR